MGPWGRDILKTTEYTEIIINFSRSRKERKDIIYAYVPRCTFNSSALIHG